MLKILEYLSPLLDDVITERSLFVSAPPHDGEERVDDQLTELLLALVDAHGCQVS